MEKLETLDTMIPEKLESSSKSSRRVHKRKERKMWKKPIKISRLPSFGFSGSDFTVDQIPIIFSGYTAESEDSSSTSEMSDDSRTYSKSSDGNEEINQERSKSVKRRAKWKSTSQISSVKVLRRQSTRKSYGGVHRLKKMRSMKRVTLNSTLKKNLDSVSREDLELLQPHYLRPTSSSASKNVENIEKNLQVARLKRIASLRYKGLLKATSSSAMKGSSSKKTTDVCNYRYCSLHGQPHSHAADNNDNVPSLKRFVSMRRKFLKRQKSVNRRLVLLKRNLSIKRGPLGGPIVTDQESKQVDDNADGESNQDVFEEDVSSTENGGNDSESKERLTEEVMVGVDDDADGVMDSVETVQEFKPEVMDDSYGTSDKNLKKNDPLQQDICQQTVMSLDHDDGEVNDMKTEETAGDIEEVCREGSSGEIREEDGKKTEDVWNETVTLVKQAFDEILMEITDDDSSDDVSIGKDEPLESGLSKEDDVGADSSDSSTSDMKPVEGIDTHLSVIVSTSNLGEESEHQKGPKKWSYLKRIILLKSFLKSLQRREKRKLSNEEDSETIIRLRRELVGERKNAEEWMLDHALRQVISTLAPSQKRKVKHLVKAFESLNPMDGVSRGPGREESETVNVERQMIVKDNKDSTDLQEVLPGKDLDEPKLTSEVSSIVSIGMKSDEALESVADESLGNHLAVEEEVNGSALGSSVKEEEEITVDSEKQNFSLWKSLIQKNMVVRDNSERKHDETEQEYRWAYGIDQNTEDGNATVVKSFQQAFEKILSEIPDSSSDEEIVSESSKSLKEEKEHQGETKRSWNSIKKVILLKRFVKSLEKVRVFNPRKLRNLPVESEFEAENVLLRHRSIMERRRTEGEELMLDYALRQAISRLAPIQRQKVELLVQAFDTVLDGHDTPKQTKTSDTPLNNDETGDKGTPKLEEDCEVINNEQKIKNVCGRFQVHQKDLKGEEEFDSTPKESRNLPPIRNAKQRIVIEKEKDSKMWKLIYKHMVTEKEGTDPENEESVASVDDECDDGAENIQNDKRKSDTVALVKEALEKILSEIPDNSSDDQSMASDITMDQELLERTTSSREITFKPKSNEKGVKGWNNVKKVILLKRFVSDLGSLTRLSPKTPRVLPWEPNPETEKIRLRHQEVGGKRNSEEWMLDYALRQAISTLAPSQKRKVALLAQAFDTISLPDMGSGSNISSAASSRNISRQSSISSTVVHNENEGNAEILRGKLRNLQEDLKAKTKLDGVSNDLEEKQQCSSLWRLLCKQMEDNERNQTLPEETRIEDEEEKEDTNVDSEKKEHYQTEAVELLGEVIDGISIEESQQQDLNLIQGETRQKTETPQVSKVRSNKWSNLKRVILLRRFVKALDNVRKFNPREPRFLPHSPEIEAEKVNLRHQETQNKKNSDEWMVDNTLQEVVSQLTPARKLKVQLLVEAFEKLSATGN